MSLFPSSFHPFTVTVNSHNDDDGGPVTISGIKSFASPHDAPSLPPLLLLHGFPQTHHIWHRVAPLLAPHFRLVAMDLRGYGRSSKPAQPVGAYAKSVMARDCVGVMDALLFGEAEEAEAEKEPVPSSFFVLAHDRGARVAHKLMVDHPRRVRASLLLDICPTLAMYEATDRAFATAYWHWFFLIQREPLPETLIAGSPRRFAELFMGGRQEKGLGIFEKQVAWEAYVAGLGDPEAAHAMCQDYRASASVDLEEARGDLREGRRIECPVRVLWGKHGVIEMCFDAVKEWKGVVAEGVKVDGWAVDSGHYVPEERPEDVAKAALEFFVDTA